MTAMESSEDGQASTMEHVDPDVEPLELLEFPISGDLNPGGSDRVHQLRLEFGAVTIDLSRAMALTDGCVVAMDNDAKELVDLYADEHLVARGELLVYEGCFCVRVVELVGQGEWNHLDSGLSSDAA